MKETIIKMHITEKGTRLHADRTYVFLVEKDATKNEVKKAVKKLYHVDAEAVRTARGESRARKYRNVKSAPKAYKKAMVTLLHGQSISVT